MHRPSDPQLSSRSLEISLRVEVNNHGRYETIWLKCVRVMFNSKVFAINDSWTAEQDSLQRSMLLVWIQKSKLCRQCHHHYLHSSSSYYYIPSGVGAVRGILRTVCCSMDKRKTEWTSTNALWDIFCPSHSLLTSFLLRRYQKSSHTPFLPSPSAPSLSPSLSPSLFVAYPIQGSSSTTTNPPSPSTHTHTPLLSLSPLVRAQ